MSLSSLLILCVVFVFALGSILGSFLNVVIHRLPTGGSLVSPPSHCPHCETSIAWYDNLPLIGWVLLGGKCRHCEAPISARYVLVEGLTGALAVMLFLKQAQPAFTMAESVEQINWLVVWLPFALHLPFVCLLVAITFIDLQHYIIPHKLTITGTLLGIAAAFVMTFALSYREFQGIWPPVGPVTSIVGALAGGFSVLSLFVVFYALTGREAIGGGDLALTTMVGAWLGWPALVFIAFAASVQGLALVAVTYLLDIDFAKSLHEMYDDEDFEPLHEEDEEPEEEGPKVIRSPEKIAADAEAAKSEDLAEDSDADDLEESSDADELNEDSDADESEDDAAQELAEDSDADELEEDSDAEELSEDSDADDLEEDSDVEDALDDGKQSRDEASGAAIATDEEPEDEEEAEREERRGKIIVVEDEEASSLALPFGPFISLAALEHLLFGTMMPGTLSMSYLYGF